MKFKGIAGVVAGLTLSYSTLSDASLPHAKVVPRELEATVQQSGLISVPFVIFEIGGEYFLYLGYNGSDGRLNKKVITKICNISSPGKKPNGKNPYIIYDRTSNVITTVGVNIDPSQQKTPDDYFREFIVKASCEPD